MQTPQRKPVTQKHALHIFLIIAFECLALGGWLLHLGLHPLSTAARNYIPFVAGLISVSLIPLGFWFRQTIEYDYVINGMLVIIGTITMTNYMLANWPPRPLTVYKLLCQTLIPEILILGTTFMLGKILFELETSNNLKAAYRRGKFWRYPNMGWWWVHSLTLTSVYVAGRVLWK